MWLLGLVGSAAAQCGVSVTNGGCYEVNGVPVSTLAVSRSCEVICNPGYVLSSATQTIFSCSAMETLSHTCRENYLVQPAPTGYFAHFTSLAPMVQCASGFSTAYIERCRGSWQCDCELGYCSKCCQLSGDTCNFHTPMGFLVPTDRAPTIDGVTPTSPRTCVACDGGTLDLNANSGCNRARVGETTVACVAQEDGFCVTKATIACPSTADGTGSADALAALPDTFTWAMQSPVLNQGSCGSCYSFAAITSFASRYGMGANLSPQELLACDAGLGPDKACGGGDQVATFNKFMDQGAPSCEAVGDAPCGGGCKPYVYGTPSCVTGFSNVQANVPQQCHAAGNCRNDECEMCVALQNGACNTLAAAAGAGQTVKCLPQQCNDGSAIGSRRTSGQAAAAKLQRFKQSYIYAQRGEAIEPVLCVIPLTHRILAVRRDIFTRGPTPAAFFTYGNFMSDNGLFAGDGVYTKTEGKSGGGHAVTAYGWDLTASPPYWRAQNSWGATWGNQGMFKFAMGTNLANWDAWFAASPLAAPAPRQGVVAEAQAKPAKVGASAAARQGMVMAQEDKEYVDEDTEFGDDETFSEEDAAGYTQALCDAQGFTTEECDACEAVVQHSIISNAVKVAVQLYCDDGTYSSADIPEDFEDADDGYEYEDDAEDDAEDGSEEEAARRRSAARSARKSAAAKARSARETAAEAARIENFHDRVAGRVGRRQTPQSAAPGGVVVSEFGVTGTQWLSLSSASAGGLSKAEVMAVLGGKVASAAVTGTAVTRLATFASASGCAAGATSCPCPAQINTESNVTEASCTCSGQAAGCANVTLIGCKSGDRGCCDAGWNAICYQGLPISTGCACTGVSGYTCPTFCRGSGRGLGLCGTKAECSSKCVNGEVKHGMKGVRVSCVCRDCVQRQGAQLVASIFGCSPGNAACCADAYAAMCLAGTTFSSCACAGGATTTCPVAGACTANASPGFAPSIPGLGPITPLVSPSSPALLSPLVAAPLVAGKTSKKGLLGLLGLLGIIPAVLCLVLACLLCRRRKRKAADVPFYATHMPVQPGTFNPSTCSPMVAVPMCSVAPGAMGFSP